MNFAVLLIGASAGGMNALKTVLSGLPADFPLPVLIVQHMHASSNDFLAHFLNSRCPLRVKQADEKERIAAGTVYLAPANYHLLVEADRTLSLSIDPPVQYARPSIDPLFESAAEVYGSGTIGMILTGASQDGSHGLARVHALGGYTVVQDPKTAEADLMPRAALRRVRPSAVLPLEHIAVHICQLLGRSEER